MKKFNSVKQLKNKIMKNQKSIAGTYRLFSNPQDTGTITLDDNGVITESSFPDHLKIGSNMTNLLRGTGWRKIPTDQETAQFADSIIEAVELQPIIPMVDKAVIKSINKERQKEKKAGTPSEMDCQPFRHNAYYKSVSNYSTPSERNFAMFD